MTGGELIAEFEDREPGACLFEGGRRGWRSGHAGSNQQEIEVGDAHQEQSVGHAAAALDVISGAAQEFAQVGEHVGVGIETENAAAG